MLKILPQYQTGWLSLDGQRRRAVRTGGFTLIEMLVVVAILAIAVTTTVGVASSISASRSLTGVHQLAAALDSARSMALREGRPVFLAMAAEPEAVPGKGQGMVICRVLQPAGGPPNPRVDPPMPDDDLAALSETPDGLILEPASEWFAMPEGHRFSLADPAHVTAGVNLLKLAGNRLRVQMPGGAGVPPLPCVGFGPLGEIVFPVDQSARSGQLLLAVTDTSAAGQIIDGDRPEQARWVGVQRHTGTSIILP